MAFRPQAPLPLVPPSSQASAEAGWRRFGPALAALVVLLAAAPGVLALPPLDRDEARFAQSSAQMLETGDLVDIRFQDQPRVKTPVGVNWLQALAAAATSSVERREIWAYRLPSLAGAMGAAAACVWGAQALFDARRSWLAGVVMGAGWLLASEADMAGADALLCAAVTLSMAALCRIYVRSAGGGAGRPGERAATWAGLALGLLVEGPVAPLLVGLTLATLAAADRRVGWMRRLSWRWGLMFTGLMVLPWALAITVSTDGGFWAAASGGDIWPRLAGGRQRHGAPPGTYVLLAPLLAFPAACLLPAALSWGWRRRAQAGPRFALAWLVPGWLLFELAPTKPPHGVAPLFGALAVLAAGALSEPISLRSRLAGAALSALAGVVIAAAAVWLAATLDGGPGWALATAALALGAGLAGALGVLGQGGVLDVRYQLRPAGLVFAGVLGIAAHAALVGGVLPDLRAAWPSRGAARLIARAGLDPRNGVTPGPVAVAGYAEPSLVFLLGTDLELDGPVEAAQALEAGRPVLVERRVAPVFLAKLAKDHTRHIEVGVTRGLDYSDGRRVELTLWRPGR